MAESMAATRKRIRTESAGALQVVRQVAAGVAPKLPPKTTPNSVFQLGQPKRISQGAAFDPELVIISDRKRGQYKAATQVRGYARVYERMLQFPGKCAEMPRDKASAFARWAKDRGINLIRESIGPGMVGVWQEPEKKEAP